MRQDMMEQQRTTPEFMLDAFADPSSVRDVVKGILNTIFFHRFFPALAPRTREVLDLTLPYVDDVELETMIEQRTTALVRQLESPDFSQQQQRQQQQQQQQQHQTPQGQSYRTGSSSSNNNHSSNTAGGGRGQITVQFFEKKRRKAWLMSRGEDEVCWESWTVRVTVAEPRTESERAKVRRAAEQTLLTTVMKVVTHANAHKDHIPPITAQGSNPFPYQINVNQKEAAAAASAGGAGGAVGATGWASRMGIY